MEKVKYFEAIGEFTPDKMDNPKECEAILEIYDRIIEKDKFSIATYGIDDDEILFFTLLEFYPVMDELIACLEQWGTPYVVVNVDNYCLFNEQRALFFMVSKEGTGPIKDSLSIKAYERYKLTERALNEAGIEDKALLDLTKLQALNGMYEELFIPTLGHIVFNCPADEEVQTLPPSSK